MRSTFDLKQKLEQMGLAPKKAFGQNFLINTQVIEKIVAAVASKPYVDLLEIGPGLGAITEPLMDVGRTPRLIELDPELIEYWRKRSLQVIDQDALKVDWSALGLREPSLLVSNLPYQISTHIVIDRCFSPRELKWMVLMFQKEVAQRLMAAPHSKEYGLLSVMAQLHFKMSKVADAAPQDFFPAPKVASRVLAFERREVVGLGMPFLKFVKAGFAFRRKFLLKNLKGVVDKAKQEHLLAVLRELGHSEKARAEELTPDDFAALFKRMQ
ncbi:MAG: ribosomal RNA small subunit methyltransferase A [Bdellovibrionales bacterium]|nr:ribosomal RNA small subunit methyltransferase A [Bdellovibrionales bacterium]